MSLSLTTAVKDKVARRLGSTTYANATPLLAALIDGEGPDALLSMEMESQWMNYLSASGNAPDAWMPYYVSEIAYRCAANQREGGEKVSFGKMRDEDKARAWEWFARQAVTYSPGTTTDAFVYTVQTVRNYCIGHTLRMKPRLLPAMESIDSALHEALTQVWNRGAYTFRRRPVRMVITRTAFTDMTWTASTKTLTTASTVATGLAAGTAFYITGGTGVTTGEYVIGSTTATTVVLNTSAAATNLATGDIAGFYYVVSFVGLESSESFDSLASVNWYYTDSDSTSTPMRWVGSDDMAVLRTADQSGTDRPRYFRTYLASGTATAWRFSPPPEQDYELRGEILVQQPAIPTAASTGFAQFAAEFLPTIRRLTLCRLLTNSGRHDEALAREVAHEVESLFPIYADAGEGSARSSISDVYGDMQDMTGGWLNLGEQG